MHWRETDLDNAIPFFPGLPPRPGLSASVKQAFILFDFVFGDLNVFLQKDDLVPDVYYLERTQRLGSGLMIRQLVGQLVASHLQRDQSRL